MKKISTVAASALIATVILLVACKPSNDAGEPVGPNTAEAAQDKKTPAPPISEGRESEPPLLGQEPPEGLIGNPVFRLYRCGKREVKAWFTDGMATLSLQGRAVVLLGCEDVCTAPLVYQDRSGNRVEDQGRDILLTLTGEQPQRCIPIGPEGARFRAEGNEPGWIAEYGKGETPWLYAEVDYGERRFHVDQAKKADASYVGTTADGVTVTLLAIPGGCGDSMSGKKFETRAKLTVGDHEYQGCGFFLD